MTAPPTLATLEYSSRSSDVKREMDSLSTLCSAHSAVSTAKPEGVSVHLLDGRLERRLGQVEGHVGQHQQPHVVLPRGPRLDICECTAASASGHGPSFRTQQTCGRR
jgi:hypothetical protein